MRKSGRVRTSTGWQREEREFLSNILFEQVPERIMKHNLNFPIMFLPCFLSSSQFLHHCPKSAAASCSAYLLLCCPLFWAAHKSPMLSRKKHKPTMIEMQHLLQEPFLLVCNSNCICGYWIPGVRAHQQRWNNTNTMGLLLIFPHKHGHFQPPDKAPASRRWPH